MGPSFEMVCTEHIATADSRSIGRAIGVDLSIREPPTAVTDGPKYNHQPNKRMVWA